MLLIMRFKLSKVGKKVKAKRKPSRQHLSREKQLDLAWDAHKRAAKG